jgi:hypothetical protein
MYFFLAQSTTESGTHVKELESMFMWEKARPVRREDELVLKLYSQVPLDQILNVTNGR